MNFFKIGIYQFISFYFFKRSYFLKCQIYLMRFFGLSHHRKSGVCFISPWWFLLGGMALVSLFSFSASAQVPGSFVYQGQILKNGSAPLEANPVVFTVQILSQTNDCVLYEEQHSINMTGSSGVFSLNIGAGIRSGTDYEDTSVLTNIFKNGQNYTGITHCTSGTSYNALSGHTRKMRISYNDGSGTVTLSQDFHMQSTPFAWYADSLQGKTSTDFVQINASQNLTQTNLENLLGGTNYTGLLSLLAGTSPLYMSAGTNGANLPSLAVDPATPQAGAVWFDSNTNQVKFYDGSSNLVLGGSGAGTGTVTSVAAGSGLTGGPISTSGTISIATGGVTDSMLASGIDASKITTGTLPAGVVPSGTDSSKLPLAGGTMTGSITMGAATDFASFDLLSTGHIAMSAQRSFRFGLYDNAQQASLVGTPLTAGQAGTTWYNSTTNKLMYWDGTTAQQVMDASGASSNVNANTGSAAAPSISFVSEGDTGFYNSNLNAVGVSSGGTQTFEFNSTGLESPNASGPLVATSAGSASAPNYSFSGDSDTGWFSPGANALAAATGGSEKVRIDSSGNVGIGTTNPLYKLDVAGDAQINGILVGRGLGNSISNTIIGDVSTTFISNTTGYSNVALGYQSLQNNTTGYYNTGLGRATLNANSTGIDNTAVGTSALQSNTIGSRSTAVGFRSLFINTTGDFNTSMGAFAGAATTTGSYNIDLGYNNTGATTGSSNIIIGNQAALADPTATGQLNIGNILFGTGVTGAGSTISGNIGVGTSAPTARLHISGANGNAGSGTPLLRLTDTNLAGPYFAIDDGSMGNGYRIIASGNLELQTNSNQGQLALATSGNVGVGTISPSVSLDISAKTDALHLPSGTTAQQPASPGNGMLRYNTTNNKFEAYENGAWVNMINATGSYSTVSSGSGSALAPSITFTGDTSTGFYSPLASAIGVTAGGTNIFNFSVGGLVSPAAGGSLVTTAAGSASAPNYSFSDDSDTGWFSPSANALAAATGGSERVRIDASGNVGIGTTSPSVPLQIVGQGVNGAGTNAMLYLKQNTNDNGAALQLDSSNNGGHSLLFFSASGAATLGAGFGVFDSTLGKYVISSNASGDVGLGPISNSTLSGATLVAKASGNIGLGTTSPSYLLALGGNSARTIGVERHSTANTAGNSLTLLAGGATSGATDKNGGDLVLQSGIATGTGSSKITFKTNSAGSTGTTDSTAATAMTIDSSQNILVGTTTSTTSRMKIFSNGATNDKIFEVSSSGVAGGQAGPFYGGYFSVVPNNSSTGGYGIYSTVSASGTGSNTGVYGEATVGSSWVNSIGISGKAIYNSAAVNGFAAGLYGDASTSGTSLSATTYGAYITNSTVYASKSYGAYINATTGPTTVIPLVVASNGTEKFRIDSSGNIGVGSTSPGYKLDVVGDIAASGCLRSSAGVASGSCVSDARLKTDVRSFDLGLDVLLKVQPHYFKYNGLGEHPASETPELGVIAQEVEKSAPELITTTEVKLHPEDTQATEVKQVNYTAFTYVLINAVKDLYHRWFSDSQTIHRELASKANVVDLMKLKSENAQLRKESLRKSSELEKIKNENSAIKSWICSKDPHAPLCY
ncbi:MAG: tail fiber domain-containing protein [Bdellovibrionaceae bacterium]|nr:tail fiber domain-containing protein [Pseudobdellovibrionaceae bacterium]